MLYQMYFQEIESFIDIKYSQKILVKVCMDHYIMTLERLIKSKGMPSIRYYLLNIVWKMKKTIMDYLFTQKYAGYQQVHI